MRNMYYNMIQLVKRQKVKRKRKKNIEEFIFFDNIYTKFDFNKCRLYYYFLILIIIKSFLYKI